MKGIQKRFKSIRIFMALANILLIICVVVSVVTALSRAQRVSFSQNIENIRTLTDACAEKLELELHHHSSELRSVTDYVNSYGGVGMTKEELIAFFDGFYGLNKPEHAWQIVDSEFNDIVGTNRGFSAMLLCGDQKEEFDYNAQSYPALAKIFRTAEESFGKIQYTNEFTDPAPPREKVCAITSTVRLRCSEGYEYKTLMILLKSAAISELLSQNNDLSTLNYFDYSNIIVDDDGNYVISNAQFQGTNFMDYIKLYNSEFTDSDERELNAKLHQADYADVLYYNNNRAQACVYTIVAVQNSTRHILSIVPLQSFHNEYRFSDSFMNFAICFGLLFFVDIIFAVFVNGKLRRRSKEAQAANEAKTDFLSRMSHDIRTPINVINGMTELAMQEDNPPETSEYLNDIRSSGMFLLGLVNDILDMNKVESGKMELSPKPYTYREFKSYINAIVSPMCRAKGIEFTVECNTEDITLFVDKMRMNQICFNLLSNAVKFTPEKGHVYLGITLTLNDGKVSVDLCVRDDGIGMSEEFQKTMFSAFSQENRPNEQQVLGTGLGLAIVKNLVDVMDGSIRAESALGCGTAFYVHFETPLAPTAAEEAQDAAEHADLRGKRILLCEDQAMNRKIIIRLMELRGVETEVAENGKIGVDMLRASERGYYDAVLMDVRMPLMNGIDAAKAIRATEGREDLEQIPIIALTANAYDSDVRACFDAGMNEHLAKPIDKQLLFTTLARWIKG